MMIQIPRSNVRSLHVLPWFVTHSLSNFFPRRRQRCQPGLLSLSVSPPHCPKLFFLCIIFYEYINSNVKCVYKGVDMDKDYF